MKIRKMTVAIALSISAVTTVAHATARTPDCQPQVISFTDHAKTRTAVCQLKEGETVAQQSVELKRGARADVVCWLSSDFGDKFLTVKGHKGLTLTQLSGVNSDVLFFRTLQTQKNDHGNLRYYLTNIASPTNAGNKTITCQYTYVG